MANGTCEPEPGVTCLDDDDPHDNPFGRSSFPYENFKKKGTAIGANGPSTDSCVNQYVLRENSCLANQNTGSTDFDCRQYGNGYTCNEGACVLSVDATTPTPPSTPVNPSSRAELSIGTTTGPNCQLAASSSSWIDQSFSPQQSGDWTLDASQPITVKFHVADSVQWINMQLIDPSGNRLYFERIPKVTYIEQAEGQLGSESYICLKDLSLAPGDYTGYARASSGAWRYNAGISFRVSSCSATAAISPSSGSPSTTFRMTADAQVSSGEIGTVCQYVDVAGRGVEQQYCHNYAGNGWTYMQGQWATNSFPTGTHTYYVTSTSSSCGTVKSNEVPFTVQTQCTSDNQCPAGQMCQEGVCEIPETPIDSVVPTASINQGLIQTDIVEKRPIVLDASGSRDDIGITKFVYNFGDGEVEQRGTSTRTHIYTTPGKYFPTVEVFDAVGNSDIASGLTVTVSSCHALDCLDITSATSTRHGSTGRETLFDVSVVNRDEYRTQAGTLFIANLCDYDQSKCAAGQTSEGYDRYGEWEIKLYDGTSVVDEIPLNLGSVEAGANTRSVTLGVTPPTRAPPAPENKPYTFILRTK